MNQPFIVAGGLRAARDAYKSGNAADRANVEHRRKPVIGDGIFRLMYVSRFLRWYRPAYTSLKQLSKRERWSRARIDAWQLRRLNGVWRHAIRTVPYYQSLAATRKLPKRFSSLVEYSRNVPLLRQEQIHSTPSALLSRVPESGGWQRVRCSTGLPIHIYRSDESQRDLAWSRRQLEYSWRSRASDRSALLVGHRDTLNSGLRGHIVRRTLPWLDWIHGRLRLNAYHMGPDDLRECLWEIDSFKASKLVGYSSAVLRLAREAQRIGFKMHNLKLAVLTGELPDRETLAECERGLGARVAVEYGSAECGIIATSRPDGSLQVREDLVFLETVENADGCFELVVSVLNNPSFPLLRYATGKLCEAPLAKGQKGFALVSPTPDVANDFLVGGDGRLVHPRAVEHLTQNHAWVHKFFALQDEDGHVCFTIESGGGILNPMRRELQKQLVRLLSEQRVLIRVVKKLPEHGVPDRKMIRSKFAEQNNCISVHPRTDVESDSPSLEHNASRAVSA